MKEIKKSNTKCFYFSPSLKEEINKVYQYPLTIIEAPMGYGKTTCVRELLTTDEGLCPSALCCNKKNSHVLWQRVYDNSLSYFWNGFTNIFKEYDEALSNNLLKLQFPNDSVSLATAVSIIEEMHLPKGLIIVIDDYHLVECADTNNFLEFLVMYLKANIHFILTTRYTSFPKLEEMILKGSIYHIQQDSFEFSTNDIISYFRNCGINISNTEAKLLYSFTEGWISALYLLMLNYKSKGTYLHTTDIFSLLEKVVYIPFSDDCKEILIYLCIFDSFTMEQALYLCDSYDTEGNINELLKKNAFVTYDSINKTYHLHSLFIGFLRDKLENKPQAYKDALFNKASKWYFTKKEYIPSLKYAYLAHDFESLLNIIEIDKGNSIHSDFKSIFIEYFEKCPYNIKTKHPFAVLVFARRLFTFNEVALFKKTCEELITIINRIEDIQYKNRLLGELELLLSFSVYNDIEKMSDFHKRACNLLSYPSQILDNKSSWTFGSPSVFYMFHRKSSELAREVDVIKAAMPYYYQITENHGMGAENVMEAEAYYYQGDFENAEITMFKALSSSTMASQSGIIICAVFLQIKLEFIKGNFNTVDTLLKKLRKDINDKKLYLFMHTLDMCESYIYSFLNQYEHISSWIKKGEFKNTRLFFPTIPFLNIVFGRSLLINGEYLRLIGSFEAFLSMASVFPNILAQIYSYIYLASANYRIFRQKEASIALEKALELSMPDKIYIPFVENCDFIKPILEELMCVEDYKNYIYKILSIYITYEKAVNQINNGFFNNRKPSLTERELEIVELAAKGLTNKEIGQKLFISPNTVKSQLKIIFEKLDINSRVLLKQYIKDKELNNTNL